MKERANEAVKKVDKMVDEPVYLFNQEFDNSFNKLLNKDNAGSSKIRVSKKREGNIELSQQASAYV